MMSKANAIEETYGELETIISGLVECYAIPHTRMCMRWSRPTKKAYREEIVGWLEDYSKSFRRLPRKSLPGREDLPAYARRLLDAQIAAILKGDNADVERSYAHLFG